MKFYIQAHMEYVPTESSTDFCRIGMPVIHKILHMPRPLCIQFLGLIFWHLWVVNK